MSLIRRISMRKAAPIAAAILIGLFLSTASHVLGWSHTSTFVVACALVAVLVALGTPLILFQRVEVQPLRQLAYSLDTDPIPSLDPYVARLRTEFLSTAAKGWGPETLRNHQLAHRREQQSWTDQLNNRLEAEQLQEIDRELLFRIWNASSSWSELNETSAVTNETRYRENRGPMEGFGSRDAITPHLAHSLMPAHT